MKYCRVENSELRKLRHWKIPKVLLLTKFGILFGIKFIPQDKTNIQPKSLQWTLSKKGQLTKIVVEPKLKIYLRKKGFWNIFLQINDLSEVADIGSFDNYMGSELFKLSIEQKFLMWPPYNPTKKIRNILHTRYKIVWGNLLLLSTLELWKFPKLD